MGCKMSTQRRKTRKTKKNEEIAPQLPEIDDISKLKRRELQRLCKRLSIKANGKVSCGHAKLLIDLSFRTKSVSHGSEWHPEILPYSRVKSCNKRHLSGSIYECRLLLVFLAPSIAVRLDFLVTLVRCCQRGGWVGDFTHKKQKVHLGANSYIGKECLEQISSYTTSLVNY